MKMVFLALLGLLICISTSAVAKPLIADISDRSIIIQTAFAGTSLMIFGARNDPGDLVIIVRGPERQAVVRKKKRKGGIWINRHSETFTNIPGFYTIATSRPLENLPQSIYFPLLGIGEENVLDVTSPDESERRQDFRRALLRDLRTRHLYYQTSEVSLISETLFKTTVPFPDTTPPGHYTAEVYLVSDGEITASQTVPINVYQSGTEARIYSLAHNHPAFYGLIAIFLAVSAGWFASLLFNRR